MDVTFIILVDHRNYRGHWLDRYLLELDRVTGGKLFTSLTADSAVVKSSVYSEFLSDQIQFREIQYVHKLLSGASQAALQATDMEEMPNLSVHPLYTTHPGFSPKYLEELMAPVTHPE
ncbi:hypothetical protein OF83DRAFT_1175181 [Amylostereum chailletii]|nr:hypothetical protein OF83DRAFT_1175181 [Amylostereum chailletii]